MNVEDQQATPEPVNPTPEMPKKGLSKKVWIVIGAVVLVLVVVVGILAIAMSGSSSNSTPSPLLETTPTSFKTITDREYALIAKDPTAHVGECVKVFGKVTQADATTGTERIRANTEATKKEQTYDYTINSLLSAEGTVLSDFVTNDQFSADVCVTGQFKYKNALGAESSAIELQVFSISRSDAK